MRIVALEYHDVVAGERWDESGFTGAGASTYKLDATAFSEHLDAVQRSGVTIANDITDLPAGGSAIVVWTFDDGGNGFFAHAADLLERHGWRGHVLMTTARIDHPGFLSKAELRDLHGRGHLIGTHSRNHLSRLSSLPDETIAAEWRTSISDLQDILGAPVTVGSVPAGEYSRRVTELAAAHGITTLFTSEPVTNVEIVNECRVVGRFTLRRGDSAAYAARLVGSSATARQVQWIKWNAKKLAKSIGGNGYHRLRERLLRH